MVTSRFELPGDGVRAAQVCLAQRVPGGDPARIRSAALRSGARALELRRAATTLLSSVETEMWRGEAHRAFVDQVRTHAPSMSATADRYEHYAAALVSYAGALEETAPRLGAARRLLEQGCAELARRQPAPLGPGTALPDLWPPPDAAPALDLLAIAREFKAGYDRWADALDRCRRALSDADRADPTRDVHGLRAIGHRVAAAAHHHLDTFERAVRHPSLHTLSDCLGALNLDLTVLGLGLLFICPPAGTACLAAATVLAAARLAVDATRRAQGEQVSAGSLGMDLAAAIPIGGGAFRALRAAEDVVHLVPGGGLAAHEGLEGGHTLAKHVGKSPEFLRNRLATEPNLHAASTFHDRQTAELAIAQVLAVNKKQLREWLTTSSRGIQLTAEIPKVGFTVIRGTDEVAEVSQVMVVLRRSRDFPSGFRIHTAWPAR